MSYALSQLSEGDHTLLFRAWDMLNNPSTLTLNFQVVECLQPNILSLRIVGPVSDKLTLYIENDRPQSALNIDVRLYDMTGRQIWRGSETGTSASSTYTYSCSLTQNGGPLPAGIYICKASISTSGGSQVSESKKFMVVAK